MPAIVIGLATLITIVLATRSTRVEPWIAAGVTLTVLSQPAAAEPHFVLLAIPLALLPLTPLQLAAVAFLLIVPLEFTAERFTTGWTALLAYPRLYAAWALWGLSIRALVREIRADLSGRCYHAHTQEAGYGAFTSRFRSEAWRGRGSGGLRVRNHRLRSRRVARVHRPGAGSARRVPRGPAPIRLSSNENLRGPSPKVIEVLKAHPSKDLGLGYPPPNVSGVSRTPLRRCGAPSRTTS